MAGKPRGFSVMDPDRQRQIASNGGKTAHARGVAHEWDAEEAARNGHKGGKKVSADRAHMAAIGRKGAESRYGQKGTVSGEQAPTGAGSGGSDRDRDAGDDGSGPGPGGAWNG